MIGIIVMGHGNFASGMTSTLELIGGKQENYDWIDFLEGEDIETLQNKLSASVQKMNNCEKILILCDLNGGSPYKAALLYSMENENVEVIYGINFPFLLDICLKRSSADELVSALLESISEAKENFGIFDKTILG